ncbi:MAG: hypothetical protein DSY46_06170 [Hydrogenimonas sp.]|nr:MAG: hypothetical protein DSY46_06170 [Hydrogenimonas sp.]
MLFENQQLTYYNVPETEQFLNQILLKVAKLFRAIFPMEQTAALILIGNYGRGEGGVVKIDGVYRPYNNLELLYIHHGHIHPKEIEMIHRRLKQLSERYGIGIDFSAVNKNRLLSLQGLVLSYDIRFGHKTLLGDSTFLKKYEKFSLHNIAPTKMRQLLINRGVLLLINRLLLNKEVLSTDEKKLIIKHAMKAIIAYGDTLLYFHNCYHWSYAQKQFNMTQLPGVNSGIKSLYTKAILFHFMPDDRDYLNRDLHQWHDELLEQLSTIHLMCEQIYLDDPTLQWENYATRSLEKMSHTHKSFRQNLQSSLYGLYHIKLLKKYHSPAQVVNFMQMGHRGMLELIFPYIAYQDPTNDHLSLLQTALHTKERTRNNFVKSFLKRWAKWEDSYVNDLLKSDDLF